MRELIQYILSTLIATVPDVQVFSPVVKALPDTEQLPPLPWLVHREVKGANVAVKGNKYYMQQYTVTIDAVHNSATQLDALVLATELLFDASEGVYSIFGLAIDLLTYEGHSDVEITDEDKYTCEIAYSVLISKTT